MVFRLVLLCPCSSTILIMKNNRNIAAKLTKRRANCSQGVIRFGSRGNMDVLRTFPKLRYNMTTRSRPVKKEVYKI